MVVGRIRKVRNSLVVTVPREEAEALDLHEGDLVRLDICKAEVWPVLKSELRSHADESWKQNEMAYRQLRGH